MVVCFWLSNGVVYCDITKKRKTGGWWCLLDLNLLDDVKAGGSLFWGVFICHDVDGVVV